ncbi:MAG: ribonuclease HI [Rhodothermales bacterium]|nr:ribonuclease HI [Rhodothermales bacterium]
MKQVIIYTDGACSGNPGPGGWAALLRYGRHERILTGAEPQTTNNRMELRAALEALRALQEPCRVALHTDSAYLARAFTEGWLDRWQRNGWKNAKKKPVENQDLWEGLLEQAARHEVEWKKVKGHADDPLNNRVDGLAVAAMNEAR